MSKAMFSIAAALALAVSPAWAEDENSDEKATSGAVASSESKSVSDSEGESTTRGVIEAGSSSGMMTESKDVRASFDERWLREREGYRDGGY